jgi:hypothetical protein
MKENLRSGWSILAVFISVMALVLVSACGDDDDDGSSGSGGQAGSAYGGSGTSGSAAGSTTAGSSGTGPMDSGTNDGSTQEIDAGLAQQNEACTINLFVAQATGVCLPPDATCEGGFSPLPGNCASGLQCCVNPDQCDTVAQSMGMTDSISCVPAGTCTGLTELPGCPSGQACCVSISFEGGMPFQDGGFPGTGGTPAMDGG